MVERQLWIEFAFNIEVTYKAVYNAEVSLMVLQMTIKSNTNTMLFLRIDRGDLRSLL